MATTDNLQSGATRHKNDGILYPVLLIAAIAVIVFSVVGIATLTGYMPKTHSQGDRAASDSAPASSQALPDAAVAPRPVAPKQAAPVEDRANEPRSRAATSAPGLA
jgi:hypothetical protein